MNMLFITEKFPPSEGGSRIYYYNLCKNYEGGTVTVLTKKVDGHENFDRAEKIKIIRKGVPLPNSKYDQIPRMIVTLLWSIYYTIREKAAVIHCGDFLPAGVIGLIIKKLFGKPYVFYVHEGDYWYFDRFRFKPKLWRLVLKNASALIAACSDAEKGLQTVLKDVPCRIFKIMPGVDFSKFSPGYRDVGLIEELGLADKRIILTVGRLVDGRKGHEVIIRALPRILADVPDTVYVIAGRGPYQETLNEIVAAEKLDAHVKFLGFVPHERLPSVYSICDVFAMIMREIPDMGTEGFGMVFTEASAAGKPVIGGRSGGTEDSIVHGVTGFRVNPLDVEEVAITLLRLLKDDELRRKMGENGRRWVEQDFDWREKARQMAEVNMTVLRSERGRRKSLAMEGK